MGRKRKYTLREDFFESIDTEEKVYWLGFLYADGYISERQVSIDLAKKDMGHLEKLAASVEYSGSIHKYGGSIYNYRDSVRLCLCSKQMANDLARLGCTQAKSLDLKFPSFIPSELEYHFIRGLFDGDGSITHTGRSPIAARFTGTKHIIDGIIERVPLIRTGKGYKLGRSLHGFSASGTQAVRVMQWLYGGASVWLKRKRKKYEQLLTKSLEIWHERAIIENEKRSQRCKMPGCNKHLLARGMCKACYNRWWRREREVRSGSVDELVRQRS